jgi:NADH:ubiquinone oxidoreductase subunit F (NADH-binding)
MSGANACLRRDTARLVAGDGGDGGGGGGGGSLESHLARLGPLPDIEPTRLRAEVAAAGLTGRGGGGFPAGRKLDAVAGRGRAVAIANGAEGEPASAKDRFLLTERPHLVLDGLQLAGRAVGATRLYLYAPADVLTGPVAAAIRERRDRLPIRLVVAPGTFVAGEESAVVSAVSGRAAVPFTTPPRVSERGVSGRPTLVQNVETLAHLALIARFGAGWFRQLGTDDEPGTRLITLSGAVTAPGVCEVAGGTSLRDILMCAGGVRGDVRAILVGGYHGGWVWLPDGLSLPLTRAALAPYDAAPGAGVVIALAEGECGLTVGADIATYLAAQSTGQCGPCLNGLPAMAATLRAVAYGPVSPALVRETERLCGLVAGRGACHHPAGTIRVVRSTLRTFATEVDLHLRGTCSAPGRRPATERRWSA